MEGSGAMIEEIGNLLEKVSNYKKTAKIHQKKIDQQQKDIDRLRAELEAAKAQLPEGMKDCTIIFTECPHGHGNLSATNWVQIPCQSCEIIEARRVIDEARVTLEGIAGATARAWDVPHHHFTDQFLPWAQSRARDAARKMSAAPVPPQPAGMKGSTHCANCGCDWLDNGLNPIGCPYCKHKDSKFKPCLNSLVRQVALMMDDCEEHADGSITIDCDISQGFLRRIYDLLNALEDCGYDTIEGRPSAVPDDVAKDALGHIAAISHNGGLARISEWEALTAIRKLSLPWWNKTGTINDMRDRADAAILSAADDEVKP